MNARRRLSVPPLAILVCTAVAMFSATGCGGDKPATPTPAPTAGGGAVAVASPSPSGAKRAGGPNSPPELKSPLIEPVGHKPDDFHPGVGDTLRATVVSSDPDGDGVTVSWQWLVNNVPISGAISDTLTPGSFKKNDDVTAQARARDTKGLESALPAGFKVKIKNSAPVITSNPAKLNGYKIVATDPDNDPVTFTMEAPVPGFTLSADGTLTFDVTKGKEANGQTVVIVAKDNDFGMAKQSIQVKF